MALSVDERDLKKELHELYETFPRLADDHLFVLWYLRAAICDDPVAAADSLVGGPNDKGTDAVFVDKDTQSVHLVQGKYRQAVGAKAEKRNDILGFAGLAAIVTGPADAYQDLLRDLAPNVAAPIDKARKLILKGGYRLRMHYVTMGRCSDGLLKEARHLVRRAEGDVALDLVDGRQVLHLLSDYLDGVAPPIPELELEMEGGDGIEMRSVFNRFDRNTKIDSWVFSMKGSGIAKLYAAAGSRLFARNVRGFLGKTEINDSMEETIRRTPEYFWYYNNGLTIICDSAESVTRGGRSVLRVTNPQVINGQQTTRTLAHMGRLSAYAGVTVRVIKVPRSAGDDSDRFETLVSQIVAATNWQNSIRQSDLRANDRRQIEIERKLRPLQYWYIRKRQSVKNAKAAGAAQRYWMIRKEEMAQAVAACDLDPAVVRRGKENLFDDAIYTTIFPNSDPYYYLCRYWLMRVVGSAAKGYPERAYAKWVVLHFLWSRLAPFLRNKSATLVLKQIWERPEREYAHLLQAANACFRSVIQFYRSNRGSGARAIDVSRFFQQKNLHRRFDSFWPGSRNTHRAAFRRAWAKFEEDLRNADA
jgi:hypothetical protein